MFGNRKRDGADIATLIGAGTTVTGDLAFHGGLHLDGRIVGDVFGEPGPSASLTIGADGVIEGSVDVEELVLGGTVRGDVTVRGRVELKPTAQVDGNVTYRVLQMAAGAKVNGRLIHEGAEPPAPPKPKPGPGGGAAPAKGD